MKALVLDFDGVISDSAPEAFVIALRSYARLRPASALCDAGSRLAAQPTLTAAGVRADPLYAPFLELMPLGNRAEDYYVILSILERGVSVEDQAAYDQERRALPQDALSQYHELFYDVRRELSDRDPETWRSLYGAYPELLALLRRRAPDTRLAIATAKDGRSVARLLVDYGIADLFPDELILDKETGITKAAHLEHLHRALELPYPELTFIDDKVSHLDAVARLGVRCALAAWGYNGPREHRLASERGYLVCSLEDAEARLFG